MKVWTDGDKHWPIVLEQDKKGYHVGYGKDVKSGLTYDDAAKRLGYCIMHKLTCEGSIHND